MDILSVLLLMANTWFQIFIDTLTNINIIWITYPVYVTWIAMEIFEEREKEISYGHAATNGVIAIWISIDWIRHMILDEKTIDTYKLIIALINFFIGFIILKSAFSKKRVAKFIGRIKVISYFQIFFSPLIYNIVSFNVLSVISIFIFFPIIYLLTELLDRLIPEIINEEDTNYYYNNTYKYTNISSDNYTYDSTNNNNSNYNLNNNYSSISTNNNNNYISSYNNYSYQTNYNSYRIPFSSFNYYNYKKYSNQNNRR